LRARRKEGIEMDDLGGAQGQRTKRGRSPRQLITLYAQHHCSETREQILQLWEEHRIQFAGAIEGAMTEMAEKPGAGIVQSDGRLLDDWLRAFESEPKVWAELYREIREITDRTAADVDREQYSRIVMAALKPPSP